MLYYMLNVSYFYIGTFRSMCAVPNMTVFSSYLTSYLPGTLLWHFPNNFEIVPVSSIVTGITFVYTFHKSCNSRVRSLYFRIFSASFLITFLSAEIATPINIQVPFSLSRIIMSGLSLLLLLYYMDVSVTGISSRYFSWTSSDPHRSRIKFHTAVLSVLCVMFQV